MHGCLDYCMDVVIGVWKDELMHALLAGEIEAWIHG